MIGYGEFLSDGRRLFQQNSGIGQGGVIHGGEQSKREGRRTGHGVSVCVCLRGSDGKEKKSKEPEQG